MSLPTGVMDELETAVSSHPRHQPTATWVNTSSSSSFGAATLGGFWPAWVNITRYCKYSQVLLMMGENIARNMQS
jgi:hypothetical protein